MVCVYICMYQPEKAWYFLKQRMPFLPGVFQRNGSHPQAEQCQRSSQSLGIPNKKHLLGMVYYRHPATIIHYPLSIIIPLLFYINLHSMMKYPTMYWGHHIVYIYIYICIYTCMYSHPGVDRLWNSSLFLTQMRILFDYYNIYIILWYIYIYIYISIYI